MSKQAWHTGTSESKLLSLISYRNSQRLKEMTEDKYMYSLLGISLKYHGFFLFLKENHLFNHSTLLFLWILFFPSSNPSCWVAYFFSLSKNNFQDFSCIHDRVFVGKVERLWWYKTIEKHCLKSRFFLLLLLFCSGILFLKGPRLSSGLGLCSTI